MLPISSWMDVVSPELALVDGALAELARRRLPLPSDCLAPCPRSPEPVVAAARTLPALPAPGSELRMSHAPRNQRPSLIVVVAGLLVLAIVGSPTIDLFRSGPTNGPSLVAGPEATSAAHRRASPWITWKKVPGAVAYRLAIFNGRQRVMVLRSRAAHVSLAPGLPGYVPLQPGRYSWVVEAIFGTGSGARPAVVSATGPLRVAGR